MTCVKMVSFKYLSSSVRLVVRTTGFQPAKKGSIPLPMTGLTVSIQVIKESTCSSPSEE